MTAREIEFLARLLREMRTELFGDDGQGGAIGGLRDDIGEVRTGLHTVELRLARRDGAEDAIEDREEVADRKEGVRIAGERLKVDSDNARWAIVGVIGGLAVPIVLRLFGIEL